MCRFNVSAYHIWCKLGQYFRTLKFRKQVYTRNKILFYHKVVSIPQSAKSSINFQHTITVRGFRFQTPRFIFCKVSTCFSEDCFLKEWEKYSPSVLNLDVFVNGKLDKTKFLPHFSWFCFVLPWVIKVCCSWPDSAPVVLIHSTGWKNYISWDYPSALVRQTAAHFAYNIR